jgi:hypothetical protein
MKRGDLPPGGPVPQALADLGGRRRDLVIGRRRGPGAGGQKGSIPPQSAVDGWHLSMTVPGIRGNVDSTKDARRRCIAVKPSDSSKNDAGGWRDFTKLVVAPDVARNVR